MSAKKYTLRELDIAEWWEDFKNRLREFEGGRYDRGLKRLTDRSDEFSYATLRKMKESNPTIKILIAVSKAIKIVDAEILTESR